MVTITAPPLAPVPEMSLAQWIASNPANNLDDDIVYITPSTKETTTWRQYLDFSHQLASGFRQLWRGRVNYDDVVCILSPNMPDFPFLYVGLVGAGLIPSPCSPVATPDELARMLGISRPTGYVVHPTLLPLLSKALAIRGEPSDLSKLPIVLITREAQDGFPCLYDAREAGRRHPMPLEPLRRPSSESIALLPYSSGTSGAFKCITLSHRNLIANVMQLRQGWPDYWEPRPTIISFLADYHSYSFNQICICGPVSGVKCVRLMKYDFKEFLRCIEKYRVSAVPCVPPVAIQLARESLPDQYDLRSLKRIMVAAAPIKPETVAILRKRYNVVVLQTFGCTEVAPTATALNEWHDFHVGSVGKLLPGMKARVVGLDGKDVGYDKEGECWWWGPNVFLGYYGDAKGSAEALTEDGWMRSGDIVRINKDGLMFVTDRIRNMIKVRGFQVAPAELEALLIGHPLVHDAGVKRGILTDGGELPVAFVVVDKPHRTDAVAKELMAHVASKVSYYKRLCKVVFLDALPRNPSGKILHRELPTLQLGEIKAQTSSELQAKL